MLHHLGESIWAHEQRIRFGGLPLWHRMTVIALRDGGLVLHSPTRIDVELQAEILRLGPVVAVVAPSWWHDLYLRETLQTFPEAALYGAEALRESLPRVWDGDMLTRTIDGIGLFLDEIVFFHRPSRSLIVADLLFNISSNDAWLTRTLAKSVIGPYPGCRFARLYRPFVFDRHRFRTAIENILEWDFDRIIVGHGAVVQQGGKEAFRAAFEWLLKERKARP